MDGSIYLTSSATQRKWTERQYLLCSTLAPAMASILAVSVRYTCDDKTHIYDVRSNLAGSRFVQTRGRRPVPRARLQNLRPASGKRHARVRRGRRRKTTAERSLG